MCIQWPEVKRDEDLCARTEQERINIQIRRRNQAGSATSPENQPELLLGMHGGGTHREGEAKAVPGIVGGESWTMTWARQATPGGR